MESQIEIWRDVQDYKGLYQVSNLGRVKSLERVIKHPRGNRIIKERILKQKHHSNKYLNSALFKNGLQTNILTHHLIAIAFLNHTRCGFKLVVNHKDFNKHNNNVENLEIVTNRQNCSHKNIISSSKYTGVCWNRFRNKWQAQIKIKGKSLNLGCHINEIDAHNAYQEALKKLI